MAVDNSPKSSSSSWSEVVRTGSKSTDSGFSSESKRTARLPKHGIDEPHPPDSVGAGNQSPSGEPNDPPTSVSSSHVMSGVGRGTKSSTTFSLSKGKELVKSRSKVVGKARGRGHPGSSAKTTPTVGRSRVSTKDQLSTKQDHLKYPPPKSGSRGITVIQPIDKDDAEEWEEKEVENEEESEQVSEQDQFEDSSPADLPTDSTSLPEMEDVPGLPMRGRGTSRKDVDGLISSPSILEDASTMVETPDMPVAHVGTQQRDLTGLPGGVTLQKTSDAPPQQPMSKPKRYSSQRQKTTGGSAAEKSGQVTIREQGLLVGVVVVNVVVGVVVGIVVIGVLLLLLELLMLLLCCCCWSCLSYLLCILYCM